MIFGLSPQLVSFSQTSKTPKEVTPAIEKKFKQEIEKGIVKLKQEMKKTQETELDMEFTVDTFRIEQYMKKYLDYDYSTAGMRTACYDAAYKYDSLLNKYYKKLLSALKSEDKKILLNAQKAWIAFRENEIKLIETINKNEYSGGGTFQLLIDSSSYLYLIRNRAIEIYEYLQRATQDH